jgi:hypothetical protein
MHSRTNSGFLLGEKTACSLHRVAGILSNPRWINKPVGSMFDLRAEQITAQFVSGSDGARFHTAHGLTAKSARNRQMNGTAIRTAKFFASGSSL